MFLPQTSFYKLSKASERVHIFINFHNFSLTMAGHQRLITDVFAQHKEISRTSKAKPSTPTTHATTEEKKDVDVEALKQKIRNKEIDVLKQFDLCWKYGPCIGITRLDRWERAKKHDMDPPEEVRNIILKYEDQEDYTQSIWHDYPL